MTNPNASGYGHQSGSSAATTCRSRICGISGPGRKGLNPGGDRRASASRSTRSIWNTHAERRHEPTSRKPGRGYLRAAPGRAGSHGPDAPGTFSAWACETFEPDHRRAARAGT